MRLSIQTAHLPPVRVVLVTDLQNVSSLKFETEWSTWDLIICLGRVVEMCTHIFLSEMGQGEWEREGRGGGGRGGGGGMEESNGRGERREEGRKRSRKGESVREADGKQ